MKTLSLVQFVALTKRRRKHQQYVKMRRRIRRLKSYQFVKLDSSACSCHKPECPVDLYTLAHFDIGADQEAVHWLSKS